MADELEFRLLRYFVVVAEELHFSRAARRLFVAQQAVSRDIRRLEERLGVRLLDRDTRQVTLTPAGVRLLARARQLLALHDETVREVRAGTAPLFGVLRSNAERTAFPNPDDPARSPPDEDGPAARLGCTSSLTSWANSAAKAVSALRLGLRMLPRLSEGKRDEPRTDARIPLAAGPQSIV